MALIPLTIRDGWSGSSETSEARIERLLREQLERETLKSEHVPWYLVRCDEKGRRVQ